VAPCDRITERVAELGERLEELDLLVDLAVNGEHQVADVGVPEPLCDVLGLEPRLAHERDGGAAKPLELVAVERCRYVVAVAVHLSPRGGGAAQRRIPDEPVEVRPLDELPALRLRCDQPRSRRPREELLAQLADLVGQERDQLVTAFLGVLGRNEDRAGVEVEPVVAQRCPLAQAKAGGAADVDDVTPVADGRLDQKLELVGPQDRAPAAVIA
jgi:hypothetical protein